MEKPETAYSGPPKMTPDLIRVLDAVRRRAWLVKWGTCIVGVLVFLGISWMLRAMLDWHWHLPWEVRAVWLTIEVVITLWMLWRWGLGKGLRIMDRHQTAVLMERRLPESGLELRSGLISVVEWTDENKLCENTVPAAESWLLVNAVMAKVEERLLGSGKDWAKQLFDGKWMRRLGVFASVLAISGTVLMWNYRPVSGLLWKRLWLSRLELPKLTTVICLSGDVQVMGGETVRLMARVEGVIPETGRLRMVGDDGVVEMMEVQAQQEEPDLFVAVLRNVRDSWTYHFEINDGLSAEHRVTVVHPPILKEVRFVQRYPDYTGLQEVVMPATRLKLLHGSRLKVAGQASKGLKNAWIRVEDAEGNVILEESMKLKGNDKTGFEKDFQVPAKGWSKLSVKLLGHDEIPSVNDPVYRIDLVQDAAPEVEVLEPEEDQMTLLADDHLPVRFRMRDDFGLAEVGLRYRVVRPGLLEGKEEGRLDVEIGEQKQVLLHQLEWDLASISPPLTPGCRVVFWLEASDGNTLTGPSKSKSIERTIEIVTEQQKRLELLEMLGQRARVLERLYEMQREANEKTDASIR